MELVNYRTDYLFLGTTGSPERMGGEIIVVRHTYEFLKYLSEIRVQIKESRLSSSTSFPLHSISDIVRMRHKDIDPLRDRVSPSFIKLSTEEEAIFNNSIVYYSMLTNVIPNRYVTKVLKFRMNRPDTFVYAEVSDDEKDMESNNEITISGVFELFDSNPLYKALCYGGRVWVEGSLRRGRSFSYIVDSSGNEIEIFMSKICRSTNTFDCNGNMIFEDDITDKGRVFLDYPGNFPYIIEKCGGEEKKVYLCGETSLKVIDNALV